MIVINFFNMKKFFTAIIFLISSFTAFAQYGSSGTVEARSMGMAKTYNTISNGILAIGINPANLIVEESNKIEFSTVLPLPYVSIKTGTNFLSIHDFNYYFGGDNGKARLLTETDKQNLNKLFENGGLIFGNASTNIFSFKFTPSNNIGAFAFSINDFAGAKARIPEALADFALTGNTIDKVYNLDDANVKAWWIRDYSLSFARNINFVKSSLFENLSAGFSIKLVNGYSYVGSERVNTSLQTNSSAEINGSSDMLAYAAFSKQLGVKYDFDSTETNSNFSPFPTPAGTGIGFDFGINLKLNKKLSFSVAVTDIGKINWNQNAAEFSSFGSIYVDSFSDKDQMDSLQDKIKGSGKYIDGFSTSLPTAFRFGSALLLDNKNDFIPGTLLLAFDYNQGFNELPGNTLRSRFSIGSEWKPGNWIPYIRTGFSVGGIDGFNWAFGLGADAGIVEFNFATSDMQAVVAPNSAKYISVAFGSRWKL